MKKLCKLLAAAVAAAVCINFGAPKLAEVVLHHTLAQKMDLQPEDVVVNAEPGVKVFMGELDSISIHGEHFRVGGLLVDRLDCSLQGVQFSLLQSLLHQQLSVMHAEQGELSAAVRSDELRNFLLEKAEDLSDVSVTIHDGIAEVRGTAKLGGIVKAQADVQGRFGMEGKKLMFIPTALSVESFGIRYSSNRIGKAEIYDFSDFPLGIVPSSVTLSGDMLTIYGEVGNS